MPGGQRRGLDPKHRDGGPPRGLGGLLSVGLAVTRAASNARRAASAGEINPRIVTLADPLTERIVHPTARTAIAGSQRDDRRLGDLLVQPVELGDPGRAMLDMSRGDLGVALGVGQLRHGIASRRCTGPAPRAVRLRSVAVSVPPRGRVTRAAGCAAANA